MGSVQVTAGHPPGLEHGYKQGSYRRELGSRFGVTLQRTLNNKQRGSVGTHGSRVTDPHVGKNEAAQPLREGHREREESKAWGPASHECLE